MKKVNTLFRKDFSVTIRDSAGKEKKVLVELQKASKPLDIMRFRRYLGNEYQKDKLPIISIYILGFNLPKINCSILRVKRNYVNLHDNVEYKRP